VKPSFAVKKGVIEKEAVRGLPGRNADSYINNLKKYKEDNRKR